MTDTLSRPVDPTTGPRHARSTVRPARTAWFDRIAGSDPGLNRLRMAGQTVVTISLILVAERLFVHLTGALQLATPAGATSGQLEQIAFANHQFTVIAMLLGAIVGMLSTFGVMDPTAKGQFVTMLLLPVPMVFGLAVGLLLGGHRLLALASLSVVLALGTYLRRFGPRGFLAGNLVFMGDFFGFFLHGALGIEDLGWLVAELGVGLAVALVVRFTLFHPRPADALRRTERSYAARSRRAAAMALALLEDPTHDERSARRLRAQLVRLNEAALMIDAQLPSVAAGARAQRLHQRLFDLELATTNVARFSQALARMDVPELERDEVRLALRAVVEGRPELARQHAQALGELLRRRDVACADDDCRTSVVVLHRFVVSMTALAEAAIQWEALGEAVEDDVTEFTPAVMLFGGWLPGSAGVSAAASNEAGGRRGERAALAPYTRTAIQMAVAVTAAIIVGDLLSGRRFYWAVIAAFITFMGANTAGEQVRKAGLRVLGTFVGILIGSALVEVTGTYTYASLAVILVALFFGFYLMRVNYAFMVVGITVMVSQLYVQLDEFSDSLLVLRLEETAIGAGVAILTVLLVLPLRTHRVLRVAVRGYVQALSTSVDHATDRLAHGPSAGHDLRADARALDAAYQALLATLAPLRRGVGGGLDGNVGQAARAASAARHYARNLVIDVSGAAPLDPSTCAALTRGRTAMLEALTVLADATTGSRDVTYVRSASLFDTAERELERTNGQVEAAQLALRDLTRIDGSMVLLARTMGLQIADLDTEVPAGEAVHA